MPIYYPVHLDARKGQFRHCGGPKRVLRQAGPDMRASRGQGVAVGVVLADQPDYRPLSKGPPRVRKHAEFGHCGDRGYLARAVGAGAMRAGLVGLDTCKTLSLLPSAHLMCRICT